MQFCYQDRHLLNDNHTYLVSDWQGEIFAINMDGEKKSLLKTKDQNKNTADIWFIKNQNLVLVPTFFDNRVVAYKLITCASARTSFPAQTIREIQYGN